MINIDHKEYQKKVKRMSMEELRFVIQDCKEVIKVNPEGEKARYYQDESHYRAAEMRRREK